MKQSQILLIFLFTFTVFILIKPAYTSLTTSSLCSTYPDEAACFNDYNCDWDFNAQLCTDFIPSGSPATLLCQDYQDEFACTSSNCQWDPNLLTCFEYTATPAQTTSVQEKIQALQSLQENPELQETLQSLALDIPALISSLNDYDSQIQTTNQDITLSEQEKQGIISNLELQIDSLLENTPRQIQILNKITNLPATPLQDITPGIIPGADESVMDEIYAMQDKMQAKTDLTTLKLIFFSQQEITASLIAKTITPPVQQGYIIEVIPIASTPDEINFFGEYEVLSYSPVTLKIPFFEQTLVSYIMQQDVSQQISQIQTGFVPSEMQFEPKIKAQCGDNICTEFLEDAVTCPEDCARKIPWLVIIIIIIIIIIAILFLHFFRDKITLSFFRLKKGKLFSSKSDKINLKNYIKESLKENISVEKIKSILLSKEWSKEQVDFVFAELEQEAKASPEPEEKPEEEKELEI